MDKALNDLFIRYQILVTKFLENNPKPLQTVILIDQINSSLKQHISDSMMIINTVEYGIINDLKKKD